ncbi:hypothetical protein BV22DRAFT_1041901 [Leucogyrophana mollusca]|uniref:Uncharacterized protein n=1 Tax=Leucogyrophana mollusca TaxID=85980 RepID=A0ACB8AXG2_9AGAM|nr:hypothetical protein BV22DRAFT_1041901 [Leucogyrophana mollusca]
MELVFNSVSLITSLVIWRRSVRQSINPSCLPLPPGPRRLSFISNVLNTDAARPWPTYSAWAETYDGIVYSSTFSQHIIIVSSF